LFASRLPWHLSQAIACSATPQQEHESVRLTNTSSTPKISFDAIKPGRFGVRPLHLTPLMSYTIAIIAVVVILLIRLVLDSFIQEKIPFLLFIAAVIISAWVGGLRPGLFATLLSGVIINYFFLGSPHALELPGPGEFLALVMFIAEGTLLSWIIMALRKSQQHTEVTYQEALESQRRLSFLSEASLLLSASLDYETTLKNVANLTVPQLADWCVVDMVDDHEGEADRLVVVHADPEKLAMAEELQRRYPPDPHAAQGVTEVLRTGRTEYVPHIPDSVLTSGAVDEDHLRMLRELHLQSYIIAPLITRGRILGAITLVLSKPGAMYNQDDVAMVEELARRAAIAVDNARLFYEGQQLNVQLEQRVQERTIELESALRDLRVFSAKLEVSNRELEEFASVASHDLQEPLRKVQAFGDRLRIKAGPSLSDEGRDYLERMQKAAGRMQTLINDLLTFSRVTSKGQPFVPVELAAVAHEVVSDLEARIEQTQGQVEIGDLPVIDADPLQMRQLFQNLIGNALKFHRKDVPPRIRISSTIINQRDEAAAVDAPHCQIMVTDNGIGFDEKYLDRIFNVFQRLHARNEYEGTGVGLAVCRRIVERHHGTITAKSSPGQGSTFIITLPVQQAAGEYII
jgi:signal transduction histidine kinase